MSEIFFAAALLACPVAMGLMMWFMMRGTNKSSSPAQDEPEHRKADAELAQLRAEMDQLRAAQRDSGPTTAERPASAADGAKRR